MTAPEKLLLRSRRRAVTLLEVIVTLAILATIAGVIAISAEASSAIGGDNKRADDAALMLARLRDAMVRWNQGGSGDSSFTYAISGGAGGSVIQNPGRLSQLTDSITGALPERNSCGGTFANPTRWHHPFFYLAIPSNNPRTQFKLAEGYLAEDSLQRFDSLGVLTTATSIAQGAAGYNGSLAIVMNNVSLSDANRLASRMEGDQSGGVNSVVRFANTNPTTVFYHMGIHGC